MTDLVMPLKIREDKSLLQLLSILQEGRPKQFAELFHKVGVRNLYLLLSRMRDIEAGLQKDYAGAKLLGTYKQKVGKRKFIRFLQAYPEISIENISDSQALVKFKNVGKNGTEQLN